MSSLIRWVNHTTDSLKAAGGPRLLIATFNRLFWYFCRTGGYRTVHKSEGRYYGVAAVDAGQSRLLAMSRPDQEQDDMLLELDQGSGQVLRRFQLASRDTHQMIRDGDRLLVTDTFRGRLLVYALPELHLLQVHGGFSHEDHVNSVRVLGTDLYLLCHNFGKSWLPQIDPLSGRIMDRYDDVGHCAHDLVPWENAFLICDSANGGLLRVDRGTKQTRTLWSQAGQFTKGLTVQDGIAYFGISPPSERQGRYQVRCDVVAFDLRAERVVWRRRMKYPGLINAISTPAALEQERRGSADQQPAQAA